MPYKRLSNEKLRKQIIELIGLGYTDSTNSKLSALSTEQARRLARGQSDSCPAIALIRCEPDMLGDW